MSTSRQRVALIRILAWALALVLLTTCAPERSTGRGGGERIRLVFLGLDGVDWRVARPLMEEGRMPHLATLVDRGTWARLRTIQPTLSPVLWTSIATGQRPERHGIVDFVARPEGGGEAIPVTSTLRRVPALWNLLSEAGRTVGVVAWWATFPVEEVNGYLVSDRVAYQLFGMGETSAEEADRIWPPHLEEEVSPLVVPPDQVPLQELAIYLPEGTEVSRLEGRPRELLVEFRHYVASTRTYTAIAHHLSRQHRPDFDALYLQLPDTASHLFMPYRPPRMSRVSEDDVALLGGVVDQVYEEVDRILGELVERNGPEAVYLVCSDHGFRSGTDRLQTLGSEIGSGGAARWHRRDGILVLAGPGIRQGHELDQATILDLAPTVMALFDLPVPEDMEGQVLEEALTPEFLRGHPVRTGPPSGERDVEAPLATEADQEILAHLIELGYLAQEGSNAANNRGLLAMSRGDHPEAISAFETALRESPDFLGARVNLGRAQMLAGRTDEAKATFAAVLQAAPDSFEVEFLLASIFLEEGDLDRADEHYYRAVAIEPNFADAHNGLGLTAEQRGLWGKAIAHYQDAINANPDLGEPYLNIGNIHWGRGDASEAERWYRQALEADSFYGGARAALALVAQSRGDAEGAEREYQEALRLGPPEPHKVWNNYGNLALRQREFAKAAERYRKAIELAPPAYAEPHNGLGAALAAQGRLDEAIGTYREAIRLAPDYTDPLRNLVLLLMENGRAAEARPLLEQAVARLPRDVDLGRWAARMHLEAGDLDEAGRLVDAVLRERPRDIAALNLRATIQIRRGEIGAAVVALRHSLALKPSQPEVERQLRELLAGASGTEGEEEVGPGEGKQDVGGPGRQ